MTRNEFIAKAEAEGVEIDRYQIDDWLHLYATKEQLTRWLQTQQLPDDIDFQEIINASKELVA